MKKTKNGSSQQQLVLGYLERISSGIFSGYPQQLTGLVGKKHGIYALYKRDRLYYVGLATDLRNRIKHHLRDRHAGKWDKFSLYLVRKAHHIKELESIMLRIASPRGNVTHGHLLGDGNLRRELQREIRKAQDNEFSHLFGLSHKADSAKFQKIRTGLTNATLAPYVKSRFKIRAVYKGQAYIARVRSNGAIFYKGKLYNSPSGLAKKITGRPSDGWWFWKYKNQRGEWIRLKALRKRSPSNE